MSDEIIETILPAPLEKSFLYLPVIDESHAQQISEAIFSIMLPSGIPKESLTTKAYAPYYSHNSLTFLKIDLNHLVPVSVLAESQPIIDALTPLVNAGILPAERFDFINAKVLEHRGKLVPISEFIWPEALAEGKTREDLIALGFEI